MRVNKLWSKDLLHLHTTIKIPLQDSKTNFSNGNASSSPSSIPSQSEGPPKVHKLGEKNIDSILQSADENLQKAIKFQQKLSSQLPQKSTGYQGSYPEVNFKSSTHPKKHMQ